MLRGGPWPVNLPSRRATIERDGIARRVLLRPRPPCGACLRRECGRGLWDGLPFVSLDLAARHAARRARALCTRASDRALVLVLSSRQAAAGCRSRHRRGGRDRRALRAGGDFLPPPRRGDHALRGCFADSTAPLCPRPAFAPP